MKFTALAVAALISVAAAAPAPGQGPPPPPGKGGPPPPPSGHGPPPPPPPPPPSSAGQCTPGTYACATDPKTGGPGWQVCNTSGQWVFAGDCPPNTVCQFYPPSKSPYCVPPGFHIP